MKNLVFSWGFQGKDNDFLKMSKDYSNLVNIITTRFQQIRIFVRYYPRIQTCQPIIRQIKRTLKKLPQNEEKRSQNRENLQKAIYVNFHGKNFLYPPKFFLSETLNFELPKNLLICYKGTLASLLLDATKTSHSCLLVLNLKQRISP